MKIDAFLKIHLQPDRGGRSGGVLGESADHVFTQAIAISGFDLGGGGSDGSEALDQTEADGKKLSARFAKFGFKIDKEVDRASPLLFKAFAVTFSERVVERVNYFDRVEVVFRKATGDAALEFLTMTFQGVLLTSFDLEVDDEGKAEESVGFRFQAVTMVYIQQTAGGGHAPPPERKGWSYYENKRI